MCSASVHPYMFDERRSNYVSKFWVDCSSYIHDKLKKQISTAFFGGCFNTFENTLKVNQNLCGTEVQKNSEVC